jgi:hypothetical protein
MGLFPTNVNAFSSRTKRPGSAEEQNLVRFDCEIKSPVLSPLVLFLYYRILYRDNLVSYLITGNTQTQGFHSLNCEKKEHN